MFDPDWPLVALAVEDLLPVILSVAGFVVLARLAASLDAPAGVWVWFGAAMIGLGGLTKPIYKFAFSLSGGSTDWLILDDTLFWLLAPGFIIAGEGLRAAAAHDGGKRPGPRAPMMAAAAAIVAVAAVLAFSSAGRAWFLLLLTVSTVGNLWLVAILIRWSSRRGDRPAAALFALNITVVFALAGSAAALPQTIPVQWGEQLAATAAQGAFLWASVRLRTTVRAGSPAVRSRSGPARSPR